MPIANGQSPTAFTLILLAQPGWSVAKELTMACDVNMILPGEHGWAIAMDVKSIRAEKTTYARNIGCVLFLDIKMGKEPHT